MMKNSFLTLLFCALAASTAFSQGSITAIAPNPVAPGYSGTVTITGTGTQFYRSTMGMNLQLQHVGSGTTYNFGNAPGFPAWCVPPNNTSVSGTITLPGNAPTGQYNATLSGYGDGGVPNNNVTGTNVLNVQMLPNVGHFNGKLVMDLDSNCTQNGLDYGIANRIIRGNPGNYLTVTDANGQFSLPMPMGTYTLSTVAPNGTVFVCPGSPYTVSGTVNTSGGTASGLDFYVKSNYQPDLGGILAIGNHRPGFWNNLWSIQVSNNSSNPASNFVVKIAKPSAFSFSGWYNVTPTSVNGDTAYWTIPTLAGGASMVLMGTTTVVGTTTIGTPYTYYSEIVPPGFDSNPTNDTMTVHSLVVGSYDPNDKQVWTKTGAPANGFVEPTDSLFRYLIRCQNTGTDTAFTIVVRDTFDQDLNMGTFTVVGASHPYTLQIPDSTGYKIHFVFNNILLPDSNTNEPLSHAWIEYTIRKKNGLAYGTVLSNRASIYFDYNSPVRTNVVNSTICPSLGTAFTFTTSALVATLHGPTTGVATGWQWNFGDGQTGTGANPVHTYATGGTYNVCVTVTNSCGRTRQICLPVTVNCAAINAGFNSSQGTGYTMNFANSSTGPISSYHWNFGDGGSSTSTSPSHTYAMPGTYTVCLTIGNVCSESDTLCQSVTVACLPMNAAFSPGVSATTTMTFFNQSTGTYSSLLWVFGDGSTSTSLAPSHTFPAPGLYNVCLILTNDCAQQDTSCIVVPIGCNTAVQAGFLGTPSYNVYTFQDQSQGTNLTYHWDFGDGTTSNAAAPVHIYNATGTFQVCLTVTDACQVSDSSCGSVTVTCVAPTSAFMASVNFNTATFTDQSTNGPTAWSWDFGDGGTSVAQSPVHNYATAGTYHVCLTASNACGPNVYCADVTSGLVGIADQQLGAVTFVPNPASGIAYLRIAHSSLSDVQFRICDAVGRVVDQWTEAEIQGEYDRTIDLSSRASGVYFLRIGTSGAQKTIKIVVQR